MRYLLMALKQRRKDVRVSRRFAVPTMASATLSDQEAGFVRTAIPCISRLTIFASVMFRIIDEGFRINSTDFRNVASDPGRSRSRMAASPFVKASVVFPSQWFNGYHEVFVGNDGAWLAGGRCTARSYHAAHL